MINEEIMFQESIQKSYAQHKPNQSEVSLQDFAAKQFTKYAKAQSFSEVVSRVMAVYFKAASTGEFADCLKHIKRQCVSHDIFRSNLKLFLHESTLSMLDTLQFFSQRDANTINIEQHILKILPKLYKEFELWFYAYECNQDSSMKKIKIEVISVFKDIIEACIQHYKTDDTIALAMRTGYAKLQATLPKKRKGKKKSEKFTYQSIGDKPKPCDKIRDAAKHVDKKFHFKEKTQQLGALEMDCLFANGGQSSHRFFRKKQKIYFHSESVYQALRNAQATQQTFSVALSQLSQQSQKPAVAREQFLWSCRMIYENTSGQLTLEPKRRSELKRFLDRQPEIFQTKIKSHLLSLTEDEGFSATLQYYDETYSSGQQQGAFLQVLAEMVQRKQFPDICIQKMTDIQTRQTQPAITNSSV